MTRREKAPDFQDRVAVVTGGGRGLGAAAAIALARQRVRLVLVARSVSELKTVQSHILETGGAADIIVTDVANPAEVQRMMRLAMEVHGHIDILVNAAGIYGPIGPSWETDPEQWVRTLHVNLVGTYLCCRAAIPMMVRQGGGRIINFSGGGATAAFPRFSAYAASKAAVVRFTETLAEELAPHNIQVNAVAPGAVDTRLHDSVLAAGERAGELYTRIKKIRETGEGSVSPELVATLIVFLASDGAGGLTGRLISAPFDDWQHWDGGRIATVMSGPWLTLRRIDRHTLQPLLKELSD